jgi:MFS family permease
MQSMKKKRSDSLLTLEFTGLCLTTFFAFCNISIFYNLYTYLEALNVPGHLRGILIGAYPLSAMAFYLFGSPFLKPSNAPLVMLSGIFLLAACCLSYLAADTFWAVFVIRALNGGGFFLVSASAMTLLTDFIPPRKSGRAFAIYSVSILLPYVIVPAAMEEVSGFFPTAAHGYAAMTLPLAPAAIFAIMLDRRKKTDARPENPEISIGARLKSMALNARRIPVFVLLLVNAMYFVNFAGLFYLLKGYAEEMDIANIGLFFSIQMTVMILIRLFGGPLFDRIEKTSLVKSIFVVGAIGFFMLYEIRNAFVIYPVAVIFGLGMGVGYPSLNALMFSISEPQYRGLNANLMMMALQGGNFLGPVLGGAVLEVSGYSGFFLASAGFNVVSLLVCSVSLKKIA